MKTHPETAPIRNGGRINARDEAFCKADPQMKRSIYKKIREMALEEHFAAGMELTHKQRAAHAAWIHKHYPGLSKEEYFKQYLRSTLTEAEFYGHFPNDEYDPAGNKPFVPEGPQWQTTILYEEELANAPHAHC